MITGDITDAGTRAEWAEFIDLLRVCPELRRRLSLVPGNHDINIIDRSNPGRLDLPWSAGQSLRELRVVVALDALAGKHRLAWRRIKGWDPNWTPPAGELARAVGSAAEAIRGEAPATVVRLPASDASRWPDHAPIGGVRPAQQELYDVLGQTRTLIYANRMWESLGKLAGLPPQTRIYCAHEYTASNARFALSLADSSAFQRRADEVALLIREAFLRGISTRQVGRIVATITGEPVSAQTVSQLTRSLDEAVEQFHAARLEDEWAYLFLDGVSLRMRQAGSRKRVHMLVAYGVKADGRREF